SSMPAVSHPGLGGWVQEGWGQEGWGVVPMAVPAGMADAVMVETARGESRELLRNGHRAGRVLRSAARGAPQHDRGPRRPARRRDPGDRLLLEGRRRADLPRPVG